jgi:hypothetical protein
VINLTKRRRAFWQAGERRLGLIAARRGAKDPSNKAESIEFLNL